MPIYIPPISRRQFVRNSVAAGAALLSSRWLHAAAAADAERRVNANRVALLADTHVDADPKRLGRGINMADHFRQTCGEVVKLDPAPAHVLINGDFAFNTGEAGDYVTAVELLKPVRESGVPVHVGLGNHDHRERFWAGLPAEQRPDAPVKDKHVALIETPRANWLMLDSLDVTNQIRGALGPDQLAWLATTLDAHKDKPALVMVHHNPEEADDAKPGGVADTAALFDVLSRRMQAKALFYGHTHRWSHERRDDGLHLVNLPAVAYIFEEGQPSGWVDCLLGKSGATLELRSLDPTHPQHAKRITMQWRSEPKPKKKPKAKTEAAPVGGT